MKRVLAIIGVWSTLAVSLAVAVPARPLFEPDPPPKLPAPVQIKVSDGAWLGKYTATDRVYVFEANGTVSYKSSPKTKTSIKNRGSWRLEGRNFYFDHNIGTNKLLEFRGVVMDNNTIVGEQIILRTGAKMPVTMKRTAP